MGRLVTVLYSSCERRLRGLPAFAFAVRAAVRIPVDAMRDTENRDKVKGLSWRFINSIARLLKRAGIWRTEGMHESWPV